MSFASVLNMTDAREGGGTEVELAGVKPRCAVPASIPATAVAMFLMRGEGETTDGSIPVFRLRPEEWA